MPAFLLRTHLDLLLFAVLAGGGMLAAHQWVARAQRLPGLPRRAWLALGFIVVTGVALAYRAGEVEQARLRSRLEGFAPTYALELELAGHARLGLDTPPDDPLYLSLIERQKRWLAVNPVVNDIYTMRRGTGRQELLLLDSETDYDRDGVFEGDREARTEIGEPFASEPELRAAFAGQYSFNPAPVTDRWGTWVSAYVPMHDSTGRVEAVHGVDYARTNGRRRSCAPASRCWRMAACWCWCWSGPPPCSRWRGVSSTAGPGSRPCFARARRASACRVAASRAGLCAGGTAIIFSPFPPTHTQRPRHP